MLQEEARQQVLQLLSSPAMFQFLIEATVDTMIQNVVSVGDNTASGDFIRGLNRGTLLLLNSIIDHIED